MRRLSVLVSVLSLCMAGGVLLSGCADHSPAPALSTVPSTVPSLDNDRAKLEEQSLEADRAQALKQRNEVLSGDTASPATPGTPAPAAVKPAPKAVVGVKPQQPAQQPASTPAAPQAADASPVKPGPTEVFPKPGSIEFFLGEFKFAPGATTLGDKDIARLDAMTQPFMGKGVQGIFMVEGYASADKDRTAKSDISNMELAIERAQAVRDTLVTLGVPPQRIRTISPGIANPHGLSGSNRRALLWFVQ